MKVCLGEFGCVIDLLVAPLYYYITIRESTVPYPASPLVFPELLCPFPEAPPADWTAARLVL